MATVRAFIRTTSKNKQFVKIHFRLSDGRDTKLYYTSEIEIEPNLWDNKRDEIKANIMMNNDRRRRINSSVTELKDIVREVYRVGNIASSEQLQEAVTRHLHPEKNILVTFFDVLNRYINEQKFSDARKARFWVLYRALKRYEQHTKTMLAFETINSNQLIGIENFLRDEYIFNCEQKKRSNNTISCLMKALRAFFNWAINYEFTENYPFKKYTMPKEVYGKPYCITTEERKQLYSTDLSKYPKIAIQRDIFVFQCLIGCRVGDLYRLTKNNIIGDKLEYIASKTKNERPNTVVVTLLATAKGIIERYKDDSRISLFPFISQQKYNVAIKQAFTLAGLTRNVVIFDSLTHQQVIRPLNEIASSHIARRTLISGLLNKAKDRRIVSTISGHNPNSKSIERYEVTSDELNVYLMELIE